MWRHKLAGALRRIKLRDLSGAFNTWREQAAGSQPTRKRLQAALRSMGAFGAAVNSMLRAFSAWREQAASRPQRLRSVEHARAPTRSNLG